MLISYVKNIQKILTFYLTFVQMYAILKMQKQILLNF